MIVSTIRPAQKKAFRSLNAKTTIKTGPRVKGFKQEDVELEDPIATVRAENEKELSVEEMSELEKIKNYLSCVRTQTRVRVNDAPTSNMKVYAHY